MAAILAAGITAVVCIPSGIFIGALLSMGKCINCGHKSDFRSRIEAEIRAEQDENVFRKESEALNQ